MCFGGTSAFLVILHLVGNACPSPQVMPLKCSSFSTFQLNERVARQPGDSGALSPEVKCGGWFILDWAHCRDMKELSKVGVYMHHLLYVLTGFQQGK